MDAPKEKLNACGPGWYVGDRTALGVLKRVTMCI